MRWYHRQRDEWEQASFEEWLAGQVPLDGYGPCRVAVCPDLAATPLGLCSGHDSRYQRQGRPGGAALPPSWSRNYEARGLPVPVSCHDEEEFRAWCAAQPPVPWPGQIILAGLAPLPAAEIRWACSLIPSGNGIPGGMPAGCRPWSIPAAPAAPAR